MGLPIEYRAVLVHEGGETEISLSEKDWLKRAEMQTLRQFSLKPAPESKMPVVIVDLTPLPDGTPRRLVWFRRVFKRLNLGTGQNSPLFQLYCVGWQATVGGRNVRSLMWIYPTGTIVAGPETPPYVSELYAASASE
jgi:hypothetical protein